MGLSKTRVREFSVPGWRKVTGVSLLGIFNFVFVQWTTYRLAAVVDTSTGRRVRWTVVGPYWPMSGWWSQYRKVGRQ